MNDRGDVVVWACDALDQNCHRWLWTNGNLQLIPDEWTVESLGATGILGLLEYTPTGQNRRAAIFSNGQLFVIPGLVNVERISVNAFGHAAMTEAVPAPLYRRAFLWRDGTLLDVGVPNVQSSARYINDLGQVVGYLDLRPWGIQEPYNYVWSNGAKYPLFPNQNGAVIRINNSGHIVQGLPGQSGEPRKLAVIRDGQVFVVSGLNGTSNDGSGIADLNNRGDVGAPLGVYLFNGVGYDNRPVPTLPCATPVGWTCRSLVRSVIESRVGLVEFSVDAGFFEFPLWYLWDVPSGAWVFLHTLAPQICTNLTQPLPGPGTCFDAKFNDQGWLLVTRDFNRTFLLKPRPATP